VFPPLVLPDDDVAPPLVVVKEPPELLVPFVVLSLSSGAIGCVQAHDSPRSTLAARTLIGPP